MHEDLVVCDNAEIVLQFDRPVICNVPDPSGYLHVSGIPSSITFDTIVNIRGIAGWWESSDGRTAIYLIDSMNRADALPFYPHDALPRNALFLEDGLRVHSELFIGEAVLRRTRDDRLLLLSVPFRTRVECIYMRSAVSKQPSRDCYYLDEIAAFQRVGQCIKIRIMVLKKEEQHPLMMAGRKDWRAVVQVCDARGCTRMVVEGEHLVRRVPKPLAAWISATCTVLDRSTLYLHSVDPLKLATHCSTLLDILNNRILSGRV
jgi:hypothetical protein